MANQMPVRGTSPSPSIDSNVKKDWDPGLTQNGNMTVEQAVERRHTNTPVPVKG